MAYNIRRFVSGYWQATYKVTKPTKAAAIKQMFKMQKESRRMGFKGTSGYRLALFDGRKKIAGG